MLDFAQLPPEVNSALIYAGPGAEPMMAAAAAWDALAAELLMTASSYLSVVSQLTDGPWLGPAAASMAAATAAQIAWLNGIAERAEQAAGQAAAAASAYETALAVAVAPAEVVANRELLAVLLATNVLGQNTPAIAATEAQYVEMWAQDAAAMYGYAGASAAASTLPPFDPPVPATNPGGLAAQGAAVAQAVGATATDTGVLATLTQALPGALSELSGPQAMTQAVTNPFAGGTVELPGWAGALLETLTGSSTLHPGTPIDLFKEWVSPTRLFVTIFKDIEGLGQSLVPKAAAGAAKAVESVGRAAETVLPATLSSAGMGSALGRSVSIGALSVPQAWAAAAPTATPTIATLGGVESVAAAVPGTNAVGGLPMLGSGAGRGLATHFAAPRYGFKPTMVAHPPAGG
ncbi:putative PPE family protein PPE65 [Mycobacterium mantenii]|uniref:PPE family protein PPE65 n=1 Tax=Mycobacterium mantenii TaxID=560555 RepID=A0A1X0FBV9_MYCNT|nr:PPE family protein [Mycobacterium mantenii]MCV7245226.1 PPE family protein [Mycobacterium mantenii]ORA99272.1 hypothetical protein BST30_24705 [Mycobacterium mantenii]BBY40606.1 putative PPE family protein PPE65 [Mycobacterium mantenii]